MARDQIALRTQRGEKDILGQSRWCQKQWGMRRSAPQPQPLRLSAHIGARRTSSVRWPRLSRPWHGAPRCAVPGIARRRKGRHLSWFLQRLSPSRHFRCLPVTIFAAVFLVPRQEIAMVNILALVPYSVCPCTSLADKYCCEENAYRHDTNC